MNAAFLKILVMTYECVGSWNVRLPAILCIVEMCVLRCVKSLSLYILNEGVVKVPGDWVIFTPSSISHTLMPH